MAASEASGTKGCAWSITINNPTDADLELWKSIRQIHWVKDAQGQLEKGEEGTTHIQGLLRTQSVRFSQVKKLLPRAHIEKATNIFALKNYVTKEETRVATLVADKVATPRVVQEYLTSIVMDKIYYKGMPVQWIEDFDRRARTIWRSRILEEEMDTVTLFNMNRRYIQAHADEFIDKAVSDLIETGYYGIEFVIANNQVRNGYKKYMCSIIIRHYASTQEPDQAQAAATCSEASTETQASSTTRE